MANYAKYTKGAMGHMLKHYERATDEHGEYLKFGNQDIDPSKTHLNYNLAPDHNQLEFIHSRLDDVYCMNRRDVNVMCTWVITAPKDLDKEQEEEFFKEAYAFLSKKYGQENVVSAYVHKDEKTAHMHFCFMPIVPDQKRGGYKVSAKECVTRSDLNQFHEKLQQHMTSRNIRCSIVNEATREGNKAIKELKQGSAQQTLKSVRRATKEERTSLQNLQKQKAVLNREIEALKDLRNIQGKVLTGQQIKSIKTESVMFDDTKVKISKADLESLKKSAYVGESASKAYEASKSYLQKAEKTLEVAEQRRKEPLLERMERLQLKQTVEDYEKALSKCKPDVRKAFDKAYKSVVAPAKDIVKKVAKERER